MATGNYPVVPAKRGRNAKRSSLACTGCKRAKRKCDIAGQPVDSDGCSNCKDKGEPCEVRYGEDKRRRRAAQANLDIESRLHLLEELLAQKRAGCDASASAACIRNSEESLTLAAEGDFQDGHSHEDGLPLNSGSHNTTAAASTEPHGPGDTAQIGTGASPLGVTGQTPLAHSHFWPGAGTDVDCSPECISIDHSVPTQPDDSSTIMDKVISREGALEKQSADHIKYFGPTSMYHLSASSKAQPTLVDCRRSMLPSELVTDIPPECDASNEPEPVVMHLLDLFWTWQASHLQVFHRTLFLAEKALYDTEVPRRRYDFFSPSLLYAIMALASMITSDRGIRYQSAGPGASVGSIYFEKAKRLFEKEMGHPSITTVQTALLIGSRYGTLGQHSLGWTYSGIAIRMAIEIGLHVDCDAAVLGGQLSPEIAQVRKLVFWGCYVQDKLWSAYCGRPSFIMDWDITVDKPEMPRGLGDLAPDSEAILAGVHQNIVILTLECSRILSELYSQKHSGSQDHLRAAANTIHGDLLKWHNGLPEVLNWPNKNGAPTSPHVLLMHMQFYFTLLLLHRPFIDFSEAADSINRLEGTQLNPIAICSLSATNITKLVRDYSLFYNLKRIPSPAIHFIFVAATIHLINHQISGDRNHEFLFQGCLSALNEIGESYPNGLKAVSVLQDLLQQLRASRSCETESARSRKRGCQSASPSAMRRQDQDRVQQRKDGQIGGLGDTALGYPNNDYLRRASNAPGAGNNHLKQVDGYMVNGSSPAKQHNNLTGWTTDVGNFDWSNYNSPITLPSGLHDIDMETYGIINGSFMGRTADFPGYSMPTVAPDFHEATDGIESYEMSIEPAASIFDRYYGTAFGLNSNL